MDIATKENYLIDLRIHLEIAYCALLQAKDISDDLCNRMLDYHEASVMSRIMDNPITSTNSALSYVNGLCDDEEEWHETEV